MYSYEWLIAVTGEAEWSDRLEIAAYNALPATISPDMWSHQYDQMSNQIQCSMLPQDKVHFNTNGADAHLFGLEPNYGCCTANFNQGWPKFALSTLMAAGDDGVAVTAIAPCRLKAAVNGVEVKITVETDYPFEDGYRVTVEPSAPVEFTLYARIPGSAKSVAIDGVVVFGDIVNGAVAVGDDANGAVVVGDVADVAAIGENALNGFIPIKRLWDGKQTVAVTMEFEPEMKKRPNGMYCVWRGPLLYALPIKEEWRRLEYVRDGVERKYPYCDYEIYPMSKWNYGFNDNQFIHTKNEVGDAPFQPDAPPATLTAKMAEIEWPSENGVCAEKPDSLAQIGNAQDIDLIPYGCTNLRMTEMPFLLN
jgi:hypothetical protein